MNIKERCTMVLRESFLKSGMKDTDIANRLGITRKTLYNWLDGKTFPTFPQTVEWFIALRTRMIPWVMKMPYYENSTKTPSRSEKFYEEQLIEFLNSLTPIQKERLYFICCEEHGSAPEGLLEMIDAHLHTPLKDRYKIASMILLNYQMAVSNRETVCPGNAEPNIDILEDSISKGKEAILQGYNGYVRGDKQ